MCASDQSIPAHRCMRPDARTVLAADSPACYSVSGGSPCRIRRIDISKTRARSAPFYRAAGAKPELNTGTATAASYLATGASTSGEFGLYRSDMGPQPTGPASHFHKSISESFFILSGVVRVFDGRECIDAKPGDFVFVSAGGIHAFRNESGAPASFLLIFAPGAPREPYFETLADGRRDGPSTDRQRVDANFPGARHVSRLNAATV